MSLWKTGCMNHYNRRKVYLCTGLVQRFPGTMFTKMGGEEEMRRSDRRGALVERRGGKEDRIG